MGFEGSGIPESVATSSQSRPTIKQRLAKLIPNRFRPQPNVQSVGQETSSNTAPVSLDQSKAVNQDNLPARVPAKDGGKGFQEQKTRSQKREELEKIAKEKEAALLEKLPSLDVFPEKSREIISEWIDKIRTARTTGQGVDIIIREIDKQINSGYDISSEAQFAPLWSCKEIYLAASGTLVGPAGIKVPPIDLETRIPYLVRRSLWNQREERMQQGTSVFSHATTSGGFRDILRQRELTARNLHANPRFNTGMYKNEGREKYDVTFAWDDHTSRYGDFAFVVPADLALDGARFTEADGIHTLNSNSEGGYKYDLDKPFVVIVANKYRPNLASAEYRDYDNQGFLEDLGKDLGWTKEQTDTFAQKHLIIGDVLDERENKSLENGARIISADSWNLGDETMSPIKQRVLEKLRAQGYQPQQGKRIFPSGEKNNLGTRHDFWLYQHS